MGSAGVPVRKIVDEDGNVIGGGAGATLATEFEAAAKVTVGTSAVELTFTGTTRTIILRSKKSNTGIIYLGGSDVANDDSMQFAVLYPGEVLTINYNDATNALYARSDTAAQVLYKGALLAV